MSFKEDESTRRQPGFIARWRGLDLSPEEIQEFLQTLSQQIDAAWQVEYNASKEKALGVDNYENVIDRIGELSSHVVREAVVWAKADDMNKKEVGTKVFLHHTMKSAVTAIRTLQNNHPYTSFDEMGLLESGVEYTFSFLSRENPENDLKNLAPNQWTHVYWKGLAELAQQLNLPPSWVDASDLTIAAFITAYREDHEDALPESWLIAAALRQSERLSELGFTRARRRVLPSTDDEQALPEDIDYYEQRKLDLAMQILTLTNEVDAHVIEIRYLGPEKRTLEETGKELKVKRETIRARESRAFRILRGLLERSVEDLEKLLRERRNF